MSAPVLERTERKDSDWGVPLRYRDGSFAPAHEIQIVWKLLFGHDLTLDPEYVDYLKQKQET